MNALSQIDSCLQKLDLATDTSNLSTAMEFEPPPQTLEELSQRIKTDKIEFVRFDSIDINGRFIGKLIPSCYFDKFAKQGIHWFVHAWFINADEGITGEALEYYKLCNVYNYPIPNTYRIYTHLLPKSRIARVLTYARLPNSLQFKHAIFDKEPRTICVNQIKKLKEKYNLDIYSAFEHEFQVLKQSKESPNADYPKYVPLWLGKHFTNQGLLMNPNHNSFVFECYRVLKSMNVNIENLLTEYSPGQMEWPMTPDWGINACDNSSTYRNIIKEIAQKYNYLATFSTIPFPDDIDGVANGAHFNFSLWFPSKDSNKNGRKNAFFDYEKSSKLGDITQSTNMANNLGDPATSANNTATTVSTAKNVTNNDEKTDDSEGKGSEHLLSELCLHFIGGILSHIESLTAFSNATVTCYRRTNTHAWSPGNASWGVNNRTVCVRVKNFDFDKGTYIEFRLPGAACNPYLVMTSVLAAGMDGIENKIDAGLPCEGDAFSKENEIKYKRVPQSLKEALDALKNDKIMIDAFGETFINWYIAAKTLEIDQVSAKGKEMGSQEKAETASYLDL